MDWMLFFIGLILSTMTVFNMLSFVYLSRHCAGYPFLMICNCLLECPLLQKQAYPTDQYNPAAPQGYQPPPPSQGYQPPLPPQTGYQPAPADFKGQ